MTRAPIQVIGPRARSLGTLAEPQKESLGSCKAESESPARKQRLGPRGVGGGWGKWLGMGGWGRLGEVVGDGGVGGGGWGVSWGGDGVGIFIPT